MKVADKQHGPWWERVADWRWRWLAFIASIITSVVLAGIAYGRLSTQVGDVLVEQRETSAAVQVQSTDLATLKTEMKVQTDRMTTHEAMPVHSQTNESMGRLDERVKGLEKTLQRVDEKMDRLLEQRRSRR